MKKIIASCILFVIGWKIVGLREYPKKCVIIFAPHTSNWDFFFGKCYAYILGVKPNYLVKNELSFWPLSIFIKYNGGIPVDRYSSNSLVSQLSERIIKSDKMMLTLSPEGTRKKVSKWRTGFYHIAKEANVPLVLAFLDFKKKEMGCYKIIYSLTNFDDNMKEIEMFYRGVQGKYSSEYNKKIF